MSASHKTEIDNSGELFNMRTTWSKPDFDTAIAVAIHAHSGQVDKAGQPYILHVMRVVLRMNSDIERIVAALHDVVEDSEITVSHLSESFSKEVTGAVEALTRRKEESYTEYIGRVLTNDIARRVKEADLLDHLESNTNCLPLDMIAKYRSALRRIQGGEKPDLGVIA